MKQFFQVRYGHLTLTGVCSLDGADTLVSLNAGALLDYAYPKTDANKNLREYASDHIYVEVEGDDDGSLD